MKTNLVEIRTYEFKYGLLHLSLSDAKSMSDEEVIDKFGFGKGPLLDKWDDVMAKKEFKQLADFREL